MFNYHHMGIPCSGSREDERYVPEFKMYVSGYENSVFRIQWHRYEADSPVPLLIRTVPHVAFLVQDLQMAIAGKKIILGPYFPLKDFQVAFIEDGGAPVELIQTRLSEKEIIAGAEERSIRIKNN